MKWQDIALPLAARALKRAAQIAAVALIGAALGAGLLGPDARSKLCGSSLSNPLRAPILPPR